MADPTLAPSSTHGAKPDGRHIRRERNRAAVLDAVLAMFEEELLVPTIEGAAKRSGLSLRSVYRYFPDAEALVGAAIDRQARQCMPLVHIHRIGRGPFAERVTVFVGLRVNLYAHMSKSFRAAVHHEPNSAQIRDQLDKSRRLFTEQFERQFAVELSALPPAERQHRRTMGDLLTQLDSIDVLRRYRRLTAAEVQAALASGLTGLLCPG